jgi:hypothetical protein
MVNDIKDMCRQADVRLEYLPTYSPDSQPESKSHAVEPEHRCAGKTLLAYASNNRRMLSVWVGKNQVSLIDFQCRCPWERDVHIEVLKLR